MKMTTGFLHILVGLLLVCSSALARPPSHGPAAQRAAPLIGRVQMREGVVDLTRVSLAEGGAAHDLAKATARVIADAEVLRVDSKRATPPDPTR